MTFLDIYVRSLIKAFELLRRSYFLDDIGTKLLILLGLLFGLILGVALTWATRQPEINKLQLQIDTITSDIQNLEKKNKDLISDKQSLENQLAEIQSKIIPSPPQSPGMVQLQADNERLKAEQAQLSQELSATTQKLLGAQKELSDLQQRYRAQNDENKSLQAQIQQLNQELGKAKGDYFHLRQDFEKLKHDFEVYKIQHPAPPPLVEPTTVQTCVDTDGNQPVLEGSTVFGANLSSATSGSSTGPSATGFILLNESKSTLFLRLTYANLISSTPKEIRFFSDEANAINNILVTLGSSCSSGTISQVLGDSGNHPLTLQMINALEAEKLYLTITTSNNPNGEIRGQLKQQDNIRTEDRLLYADGSICKDGWHSPSTGPGTCSWHGGVAGKCPYYSGCHEYATIREFGIISSLNSDPKTSATQKAIPSGTAYFQVNSSETELSINLTYVNITGAATAIHLHKGKAGEAGLVVYTICDASPSIPCSTEPSASVVSRWKNTDTQQLTPELIEAVKAGDIYIEVDTAANPHGEIRGQLIK